MEEKLLRCPNCGANASNHQNCEYCGSLLVRFVGKGIDLSKTTYMSNAEVFPGLLQNLQQNLKMQESSNEFVVTDIWNEVGKNKEGTNGALMSILQTGRSDWKDGQNISIANGNQGLCIVIAFSTYVDESVENLRKFNRLSDEELARFERLECFPLFTPHISYYMNLGEKMKSREYAIDFGKDAEGAARLISEILQKVYDVPLSERIEIFTNQGDAVEQARIEAASARGHFYASTKKNGIPDWVWFAAAGICILIKACS